LTPEEEAEAEEEAAALALETMVAGIEKEEVPIPLERCS